VPKFLQVGIGNAIYTALGEVVVEYCDSLNCSSVRQDLLGGRKEVLRESQDLCSKADPGSSLPTDADLYAALSRLCPPGKIKIFTILIVSNNSSRKHS
jgi:hypothetical protein